jgi:gliding motility-associated lipoprotein GldH
MRLSKIGVLILATSLVLVSCFDIPEYSESRVVDSKVWASSDTIHFDMNIANDSALYDCFVDVRHTGDYPFSNLYLFLDLTYPNGKHRVDTLECVLADKRGKWYGSGLGDIVDHRIEYKSGIKFPAAGSYSLDITHGMRVDPLDGVTDMGFRIERVSL